MNHCIKSRLVHQPYHFRSAVPEYTSTNFPPTASIQSLLLSCSLSVSLLSLSLSATPYAMHVLHEFPIAVLTQTLYQVCTPLLLPLLNHFTLSNNRHVKLDYKHFYLFFFTLCILPPSFYHEFLNSTSPRFLVIIFS